MEASGLHIPNLDIANPTSESFHSPLLLLSSANEYFTLDETNNEIKLNSYAFIIIFSLFISFLIALSLWLIRLRSKHRLEKSLRVNAENYSSLFKENQSIMLIVEPTFGHIVDANHAACRFFGFNYDHFKKLKLGDLLVQTGTDINHFLKDTIKQNKQLQAKARLNSEQIKDIDVHAGRIEFNDGIYIFTTVQDISKRIEQEKLLIEARRKAEESDFLKSTFLANMSHEIRTPMNIILGFSSLLNDPDIDETTRGKYIHLIQDNGEHLLTLINDIIDLSKIEANQLKIKIKESKLNRLMEDIHQVFSNQLKVTPQKNNIKLSLELGISNPDFAINTDPLRLKQILLNLLSNALKFTDKGEIRFGYVFREDSVLQFFVKDTGIGIPDHKQKTIFTAFEQVELNNSRNYGGTGLGLSICKSLVDKLGGHIWVMSELGKGSRFYFTISTSTNLLHLD